MTEKVTKIENEINKLDSTISIFKCSTAILVFLGFLFLIITTPVFENNWDYLKLTNYGTIHGGITSSLFSLAGLLLIYVAFLGQKQQIKQQQIEIIQNKEELKNNTEALILQRKEMSRQNDSIDFSNFENTFFKLLENYNSIKNSLYYMQVKDSNANLFASFVVFMNDDSGKIFFNKYNRDDFEKRLVSTLNYLRNFDFAFVFQIDNILKFIDNSNISNESKIEYSKFLASSLSKYESIVLNILCLSDVIEEGQKKYITKYHFDSFGSEYYEVE